MNNDRFSLLAGIASDWWWEMDADLRFTFLSGRVEEMLGLPVASMIGKRRTDLPRDGYEDPSWSSHLEDLANRRPFRNFETTIIDAWGVARPVMISGTPRFADDGTFLGCIGVTHDLTELRRSERKAAATAANLESILENIDQGVVLFDRDHKIVAYNRNLADWLQIEEDTIGVSYEEIVRRLAERGEYAPQEADQAIAMRLAFVRTGGRMEGERRRRDGRVMSVVYNPLPGGGGVMTYADVTEARDREARLQASESRFRYLFQSSPMPMWVYSIDKRHILEVNDAAIAVYGYSREEFLKLSLYDLRPPDEAVRLRKYLHRMSATQLYAGEWRHRRKDGRLVDVDVYVHDIEFGGQAARLALLVDITERKQAERESGRIFETTEDLFVVTGEDRRFVRISPSSEQVLGYLPEEMLGRHPDEFLMPEDQDYVRDAVRRARAGTGKGRFRSRYRHKDGHAVPLSWTSVWSEHDRRTYWIGRDMTEYDNTAASLRQAVKMEAIGQLTGGVAHDFNNILMVIMANLDALAEEGELGPDMQDRVGRIAAATQRASDLTRQLLAFSRRQALHPAPTNINELVNGTAGLLRRTLGEVVEVETVLSGGLWPAEIDRAQLEAALVNLAINARDAMPEGGRLTIGTRNHSLAPDDAGDGIQGGDYVLITVSDTGKGIPRAMLDKVFEPFFTTKDVGKGTGLGLSMVYGFMQQSRGHVRIDSELGRGTVVRLYLPRSGAPTERPVQRVDGGLPGGDERILVVEDDPHVRAGVLGQLKRLGYNAVDAVDGMAGLAAFEAAAQPFDLLLTDVMVPGPMNGKALADEVARRWPGTRVVFM